MISAIKCIWIHDVVSPESVGDVGADGSATVAFIEKHSASSTDVAEAIS